MVFKGVFIIYKEPEGKESLAGPGTEQPDLAVGALKHSVGCFIDFLSISYT